MRDELIKRVADLSDAQVTALLAVVRVMQGETDESAPPPNDPLIGMYSGAQDLSSRELIRDHKQE